MTRSARNIALFTMLTLLAFANASTANPEWKTFTATDAGFSVAVPGAMQETKPDNYDVTFQLFSFTVIVQTPGPLVRKLALENRPAALKCLAQIRDGGMDAMHGKVKKSSFGEVNGFPSLRYAFEVTVDGLPAAATNLIVLTDEHLYIVMAFAPKEVRNPHVDRFLGSFRVLKSTTTAAAGSPQPVPSAASTLATVLAGPMFAVARQIAIEESNSSIDHIVQNAPPAKGLGTSWGPSHRAWPKARAAVTGRIARLAEYYEKSEQFIDIVDTAVGGLAKSEAAALVTTLKGSAGPAIVRANAYIHFVSQVTPDDPINQPDIGTPAWKERMRTLHRAFEEHIAPALPPDDGAHKADSDKHLSTEEGRRLSDLFRTVTGKAATEFKGGIRLMMFDDREAIWRDIKAAIGSSSRDDD